MARVTKVRRAETEEHGDGTAVPALVFQQVGAVFRAHLGSGHVAAAAAHQFGGVVVGAAHVQFAPGFAPVVGLPDTIIYNIICDEKLKKKKINTQMINRKRTNTAEYNMIPTLLKIKRKVGKVPMVVVYCLNPATINRQKPQTQTFRVVMYKQYIIIIVIIAKNSKNITVTTVGGRRIEIRFNVRSMIVNLE